MNTECFIEKQAFFLSYDRIELAKDKTIDHKGELYTRRVGKEMSSVSADQ